jgi:lipoprotein signal peptidase
MKAQAERSYRWLFWGLVVVGFAVDQGAKYGIFHALYNEGKGDRHVLVAGDKKGLLPGYFALEAEFTGLRDDSGDAVSPLRTWGGDVLPWVNRGALFGLGNSNEPGQDFNFAFLLVSLFAAVAIIVWSVRGAGIRDMLLCVALGLVLAGTMGNLYDRVVFSGVRDFLHFQNRVINWPVFNLADVCLVCGAGLLLWQALCGQATVREPEAAEPATAFAPSSALVERLEAPGRGRPHHPAAQPAPVREQSA